MFISGRCSVWLSMLMFLALLTACGGGGGGTESNVSATLQFSNTTKSATEGTDDTITITVTRTGSNSGAASVHYATSDSSATIPSDYTSTNGTLNWASGDSAPKSFSVPILDDNTAEPAENFIASLNNVAGASLGANSSTTVTITDDDADAIQGRFIDPIIGLHYVSGNQSGFTDANGAFYCEPGSTVSFSVGDILIGTTDCHELISPVEIVPGAIDETHPMVSNIFAFLQTIDDDNDASNGITITQAVIDAAASQNINFDQSTADFAMDANVINIVAALTAVTTYGAHDLTDASDAQSDLNSILLNAMAGIYNGIYSGDGNGTWSMTIASDGSLNGSVCNTGTQNDFLITGSITSSGTSTIDATGSGGNGTFSGTVSHDGEFNGSWSQASSGGAFIGSRQGVSVGGTCILPGGNIDITGADTGVVGFSFIPVYDGLSFVTDTHITILAFDINPFTSPNVDTRTMEIVFGIDSTPLGILFRLYNSGMLANEYSAICSQDDCSGMTIDTSTQTITLSNVEVLPSTLNNNSATNTLSLNGSFVYTISTP